MTTCLNLLKECLRLKINIILFQISTLERPTLAIVVVKIKNFAFLKVIFLYHQMVGVPMGTNSGPQVANVYLRV